MPKIKKTLGVAEMEARRRWFGAERKARSRARPVTTEKRPVSLDAAAPSKVRGTERRGRVTVTHTAARRESITVPVFVRRAGYAFLASASNPRAPMERLSMDIVQLEIEFKKRGLSLRTLRLMCLPADTEYGRGRLIVSNGRATFTVNGINYYRRSVTEARAVPEPRYT